MKHPNARIAAVVAVLMLLLASSLPVAAQPPSASRPDQQRTPVVLFPGFGGTRLEVRVHNQTVALECPRSGTFEYILGVGPNADFSQVCQDKLLTLVYNFAEQMPKKGPAWQISEQHGVKVRVADYGRTESVPGYEALYAFLEQNGYQRNVNIRTAGYDFRLTPDMGGFMKRTTELIEETYRENGNTPVHLVGHSNGPLYAHYLLTHTTQQWKNKYIHGFTSLAGNYPGQGWMYMLLFLGFNAPTMSFPTDPANAATSAAMYASHPSTYMSASDPAYFGDSEVVIGVTGGKDYTPALAEQLFKDAGLELAQKIAPYYFGFIKFQPPFFPYVDTYAEKGSGLPTLVGIRLPDLTVGQVFNPGPDDLIMMDGDANQEDITNDSVRVWQAMPCYHFELVDTPGLDHFTLGLAPNPAYDRLLMHLQQPRSECR